MAKSKKLALDSETAALIFLGVSRPLRLEAEIAGKFTEEFERVYEEIKGAQPKSGRGSYHDIGTRKWGRELRIYFNASPIVADKLRSMGFHVEEGKPYNSQYSYRINSFDLWWKLVEMGFNLGDNP